MVIFYCAVYMDTSFNIMKIASPNPDANEYEMSIKSKPIQSKKLIETSNALERVVSIRCMYPHCILVVEVIFAVTKFGHLLKTRSLNVVL